MNVTLNLDFGQVEADPSVVNLTAFETYYEEKRPFFIEGRNILNFQIMGGDGDMSSDNLFYTRRIGRSPQYFSETSGFVISPRTIFWLFMAASPLISPGRGRSAPNSWRGCWRRT